MALIIITGGGPLIIAVGTGIKLYSPVLNSSRDTARRRYSISRVVEREDRGFDFRYCSKVVRTRIKEKKEDCYASMIFV